MTIYVGNLAYTATVEGLRDLFDQHEGEITKVIIPTDRETGRPRGFAFVEFASEADEDAICLIYENKELEYLDRPLKINKAKPREEGAPRGDRPSRPRSSFGGDRPQRSGFGGDRPQRSGFGGGSGSRSGSSSGGRSGERRSPRGDSYNN